MIYAAMRSVAGTTTGIKTSLQR